MTIALSVIGLGKIGTSIGLALREYSSEISLTGFDREQTIGKKALELKAFDHIAVSIEDSIKDADIIILAVPVDEIRITIETIAPLLKPEAVLIDTSPIKISISEYVQRILPEECFYVSLYPTLNPTYLHETEVSIDFAHKDLFQNSFIVITSSSNSNNDVIKLAADLTGYLGAQVLFADPYEVDGLLAAVEILPKIISAAYIHALVDQPGWQEGQKLAGSSFHALSQISTNVNEREFFGKSALLNKENTIRTMNNVIFSLETFRDLLNNSNPTEICNWFSDSLQNHNNWLNNRKSAVWNDQFDGDNIPTSGEFLKKVFGFNFKKGK